MYQPQRRYGLAFGSTLHSTPHDVTTTVQTMIIYKAPAVSLEMLRASSAFAARSKSHTQMQYNMQLTFIIFGLLNSILAAPVAVSVIDRGLDNDRVTVSIKTETQTFTPRLAKRQSRCDISICQQQFNNCVSSCESLSNGDW